MSSHTEDSSSSSSSSCAEEYRRKKSSKRQKNKSEKKLRKKLKKKNKEEKIRKLKKRIKKHEDSPKMQHIIAPHELVSENDGNANIFGPVLPPHLQKIHGNKIIGPLFDKTLLANNNEDTHEEGKEEEAEVVPEKESIAMDREDSQDAVDIYGPTPINESGMSSTQLELEQRALELKLAAIEGKNTSNVDIKTREEWMLELPQVGLRGGLAALATMKRTFHQGKEKPDFSDRSEWTKTPQSVELEKQQKPTTSKQSAEEQKKAAHEAFVRKRDEEQESIARRHKKKYKLEASLVEIHQKKLRKEQKKKEKELLKSGAKAERRPFTRDVDLKLNKIDSHQTKQIVDKAKILNTKFSTGQAKYL